MKKTYPWFIIMKIITIAMTMTKFGTKKKTIFTRKYQICMRHKLLGYYLGGQQ